MAGNWQELQNTGGTQVTKIGRSPRYAFTAFYGTGVSKWLLVLPGYRVRFVLNARATGGNDANGVQIQALKAVASSDVTASASDADFDQSILMHLLTGSWAAVTAASPTFGPGLYRMRCTAGPTASYAKVMAQITAD